MYLFPVLAAVAPWRLRASQAWVPWSMVATALALMIGLRHQVGGDWNNYLSQFWLYSQIHWLDAMQIGKDPGYYGISSMVAALGGNIYVLNLICALPLVAGAVALARRQPYPWIALAAAIPYLLIVVGMGYTRQAAAIGCAMLGLVALGESRVRWFVFWVFVGATFHKTAVLLIPIAALAEDRNRIWTASWVALMFALGAWLFLYESSDVLVRNYVQSDYADASQGAGIRVAMNAVPSVLAIFFGRRIFSGRREKKLWIWMAVLSLLCVPLLSLSATAVDRMALYFIPLQLVVFSRLPCLVGRAGIRLLIKLSIVLYYAVVQFVWLSFAGHSEAWLPYSFFPLAGQ